MPLIKVKKIATGAGPLLLDSRDPRIGTVFAPWDGPRPAPATTPATPATPGAPPAPPAEGSGAVPGQPAGEAPAGASGRREPTRDEVAAYLAHRGQGLSHQEACLAVWPDLEPPEEPDADEMGRIRERLAESVPGASLGTGSTPESEKPAGTTTKRAPRKPKGNDLSAYDMPVDAGKR